MKKLTVYKEEFIYLKYNMIKNIALVTLLIGSLYNVHANKFAANCIGATRKSQFPSGDERARSDFCTRMNDMLGGITDVEALEGLCTIDENSADYKAAIAAAEAAGDGTNATLNEATLAAYATAITCNATAEQQETIMTVFKNQLRENNLVVKSTEVSDLKTEATAFVQVLAESSFIQKHVQEKISDLKQEESQALEALNDVDASVRKYIDMLVKDLKDEIAVIGNNINKNGELTARQIQNALNNAHSKVQNVKDSLKDGADLAKVVKQALKAFLNKVEVFRAVSVLADGDVDRVRAEFVTKAETLIIDAWNNFEKLSDSDATLDPSA